MIKIVVVGTRGFPDIQGGVEKHCEHLYVNLAKLGVEVIVFTRKPYVVYKKNIYKGVRLISLAAIKNKFLEAYLHTLLGVVLAVVMRPDILHVQAIGPSFFVPLARLFGLRVVVTTHGANYKHLKWGRIAKTFLRVCEFIGIKTANEIIAISQSIADDIKVQYGRNVVVIPNGVNLPIIEESESVLRKYGVEY